MWLPWKKDADAAAASATIATRHAGIPRSTALLTGLGGATVAILGLWALRPIAAPVLLALVLTICAQPVRYGLERAGVPRGLATGGVVFVVFTALAGFVVALALAFAQFATLLPTFAPQLRELGVQVADGLTAIGIGPQQVEAIVGQLDPGRIVDLILDLFGGLANVTAALAIVLTTLILMGVDAGYVRTLLTQLRPDRPLLVTALERLAHSIRRYMVATTILGLAQGVLNSIALVILGVPGAFLWGLLAFLCSFIPNVGYFIALIPPVLFGYLVGGWQTALPVIIVYAVINGVVQTLVQPKVIGNAVALSQTLTFVSVLFWAAVLGPVGAILAIPLTLIVRAVIIDTDPTAGWLRPLSGDLGSTRSMMKVEDAERRAGKKSRRASRRRP